MRVTLGVHLPYLYDWVPSASLISANTEGLGYQSHHNFYKSVYFDKTISFLFTQYDR